MAVRGWARRLFCCLWAVGGCSAPLIEPASPPPRATARLLPEDPVPLDWKSVVAPADLERIGRTAEAWTEALAEARAAGFRRAVAGEDQLLDPMAALPRPELSPGPYQCRLLKLGRKDESGPAFAAYRSFYCYVDAEGALLTMVKQTGTQRPAGRIWPDSDSRQIFLGGLAIDDEEAAPGYGADGGRDVAGLVERVAPFRWRLVMPWPRTEAKLDVLELVPVTPPLPPAQ